MSFLSIQLLNKLLYFFHLTYSLSPFLLITFSIPNYFCFFVPQFVSLKLSSNLFSFKKTNNICSRHSIFNFFNHKNFFRSIWNVTLCKNIFIFLYSISITNFKFRIFIINFYTRVNICASFHINRFNFNCTMICIVVFINYIINLKIYTFSESEVICL